MSNQGSALIDAVNAAYPAMSQLYAADWYVLEAANEGYYVGAGCAVTASGTAGKVDLSLGITLQGGVEVNVAAVTAATTTITSLADATNPKWVALEIDSAGALNFNSGSAAANPEKPTPTSARVMVAWLYVPANATAVDALTSNPNGKAKIIDARQLVPGVSATGWQYEQGTLVYGFGSTFSGVFGIAGDQSATYRADTKISWNDGTSAPGYSVVGTTYVSPTTTSVSSNTTTNQFTKTAHGYNAFSFNCVVASGFVNTLGITNGQIYWVNYVDANTFTLANTFTGTAIDITGSADSSISLTTATTLWLIQQSDYFPHNATIKYVRYSYAHTPQGFPSEFSYVPTISGYAAASNPTNVRYTWTPMGTGWLLLALQESTNGTSGNATHTYSLPIAAKTVSNGLWGNNAICIDNATTKGGYLIINSAGTVVTVAGVIASGNNTASGGSRVVGQIAYPFV